MVEMSDYCQSIFDERENINYVAFVTSKIYTFWHWEQMQLKITIEVQKKRIITVIKAHLFEIMPTVFCGNTVFWQIYNKIVIKYF